MKSGAGSYRLSMIARRSSRLTGPVLVSLLLVPASAGTEPKLRFPAEQPVAIGARVALLEGRVHELEQRLSAFSRLSLTPADAGGFTLVAHGVRVQIAPSGQVSLHAPPAPVPSQCEPPFVVDADGKRSAKPECLEVSPCDPPFVVDSHGVRRAKPGCP